MFHERIEALTVLYGDGPRSLNAPVLQPDQQQGKAEHCQAVTQNPCVILRFQNVFHVPVLKRTHQ